VGAWSGEEWPRAFVDRVVCVAVARLGGFDRSSGCGDEWLFLPSPGARGLGMSSAEDTSCGGGCATVRPLGSVVQAGRGVWGLC